MKRPQNYPSEGMVDWMGPHAGSTSDYSIKNPAEIKANIVFGPGPRHIRLTVTSMFSQLRAIEIYKTADDWWLLLMDDGRIKSESSTLGVASAVITQCALVKEFGKTDEVLYPLNTLLENLAEKLYSAADPKVIKD